MADQNLIFQIYNADGTSFHGLSMDQSTFTDSVMSLNTKIEGDIFYPTNDLVFNFSEYIIYNGVKYYLQLSTPPTIVKKSLLEENGDLKGMTKYSLTFYHPMILLFNIPFTDVAISTDEQKYKSENTTFYWIGTLTELVAKINNCLNDTLFTCALQPKFVDDGTSSGVIQFDKQMISDVLKTAYDKWKVPFVVDGYNILFGKSSNEVYTDSTKTTPYIFRMGQGLGLLNNDRTPKKNQIVTRIAGYGSESNIPNGYPLVKWEGNQSWNFTIDNDGSKPNSYPIINGVIDGQLVKVINHPFTRKTLMPNVYVNSVIKKVKNYSNGNPVSYPVYDPTAELIDYYDADDPQVYQNVINVQSPLYYKKGFDGSDTNVANIKPSIVGATYNGQEIDVIKSISWINDDKTSATGIDDSYDANKKAYNQGYFKIEFYPLGFDLYAMAAVTNAMSIVMSSGLCNGSKFEVQVDWDVFKTCFYNDDGTLNINKQARWDSGNYPDSTNASISAIVKKDTSTFGTLMPNIYQQPKSGDKFVFEGIDMPQFYISNAQNVLDTNMKQWMKENNIAYYEYPFDFDECFLTKNPYILSQIKTNCIIRFEYAGEILMLSVKDYSISWGQKPLPTYKITLTNDVSVTLNPVGQVADGLSKLGSQVAMLQAYYGTDIYGLIADKLSRTSADTARGIITFLKGLRIASGSMGIDQSGNAVLNNIAAQLLSSTLGINIGSDFSINQLGEALLKSVKASDKIEIGDYLTGLLGKGAKIDSTGAGEMRSLTLWESLTVPQLNFNRVEVLVGMDFQTKGGGLIDSVTIDKDDNGNDLNSGTCKLHLEDGEFGAIAIGDLCMGIFHNFGGSNSATDVDNHTGLISKKGFNTSYFEITEITNTSNNGEFKYILRNDANWAALSHPQPHMNFAQRGNTNDTTRQSFKYRTTEYSIGLTNVNTWEFGSGNIYYLEGNIDGWTVGEKTFTGYGIVIGNAYIFGSIDQFEKIGYTMSFDLGGDQLVAYGETKHIKAIIKNGYGADATSLFSNWTITRNSGDTASDNIWNASAVISDTGEFDITWSSSKSDLGAGLSTIFAVMATKGDKVVSGNLTF